MSDQLVFTIEVNYDIDDDMCEVPIGEVLDLARGSGGAKIIKTEVRPEIKKEKK